MYNMLMDNYSFDGNDSAATSPAVAPMTSNKQGGRIIIAAIIALLVGAAIASAIFITINNSNKNGGNTANNSSAEKNTTLDARLTAELAYKTNRIIVNTASSERAPNAKASTGRFEDYVNLDDQMRADIVISGWIFNNAFAIEEIKPASLPDSFEKKQQNLNYNYLWIVRIDDYVKSEYRYLFGKEFTNFPAVVASNLNTQSCPATYVEEASYYVLLEGQCGHVSGQRLYQYKYELDDDKAYVYFGMMAKYGDGADLTYFNGFRWDNKIISGLTKDQKEQMKDQPLSYWIYYPETDDSTDRSELLLDKVQHYRAVFEKGSDGDFYYKTLEKVDD